MSAAGPVPAPPGPDRVARMGRGEATRLLGLRSEPNESSAAGIAGEVPAELPTDGDLGMTPKRFVEKVWADTYYLMDSPKPAHPLVVTMHKLACDQLDAFDQEAKFLNENTTIHYRDSDDYHSRTVSMDRDHFDRLMAFLHLAVERAPAARAGDPSNGDGLPETLGESSVGSTLNPVCGGDGPKTAGREDHRSG